MSVNKINHLGDMKKLCRFTILNCGDLRKFLKGQWFLHLKNYKVLRIEQVI
jgi:hypothetical protein